MNAPVLLAMLGAGVLSFANPCVLPLVPVWSALALGSTPERPGQVLRSTLPFVAGMATVFAGFGAAAGAVGGVARGLSAWIPRVGGGLLVLFGLVLVGFGPAWARRDHRLPITLPTRSDGRGIGPLRGLVGGVVAGAAWTPCVGPLLGAALVVASDTGGAVPGATLLAVYAVGVGVPFVAVALAMDAWPRWSLAATRHGAHLRIAAGALLVVTGAAIAAGMLDRLVAPAVALLPGSP